MSITWNKPSGTVSYYVMEVRRLLDNTVIAPGGITLNAGATSFSMQLFDGIIKNNNTYRFFLTAYMSDGSRKTSETRYFYIGFHSGVYNPPLYFRMWDGFALTTQTAIRNSAKSWNDLFTSEKIRFTPTDNYNFFYSGDGINRISKVATTQNYLMATAVDIYFGSTPRNMGIESRMDNVRNGV